MSALTLAARSRARKSNLAFALFCLPRDRRRDAMVFYDFCRVVDDIADDPHRPADAKRELLRSWDLALQNGTGLPAELADLITRRRLDTSLLREIVHGVEMDIEPQAYLRFEDLQTYCWKVACAVGLVSLKIFGCEDPASRIYAENLGYALQLTNILRDVAEDASLGRIYLPREDLVRFQVKPESLFHGRPGGDFSGLMNVLADRAAGFFAAAREALPDRDAAALLPAEIMRALYERILDHMRADGFRVFQRRYRIPLPGKIWLAANQMLRLRTRNRPARTRA